MQADADYERMDALNDARRRLGAGAARDRRPAPGSPPWCSTPSAALPGTPAAAILVQPLPVDLDRSVAEVKDLAVSLCPDFTVSVTF